VSWESGQWTVWDEEEPFTGIILDENDQPQPVQLDPCAINEVGDICGWYGALEGPFGAFLLLVDGTLIDLPPLESKRYITRSNSAYDLNDAVDPASIQIVGDVAFFPKHGPGVEWYAAVWQGGNVIDLEAETTQPDSDLSLRTFRISNHGWLAGRAIEVINPGADLPRAAVVVPQ
jgi:hypothetical protein